VQQIQAANLTEDQAAEIIGVTARALQKWRETGRYNLPFIRIGRRIVRYRPQDIEAFLSRQTVRSQPATV
jgi:predicted site-specific integrase-resolvase